MFARAARTLGAIAAVIAVLEICFHIPGLRSATVTFALILTILWISVKLGRVEGIVASLVAAMGFAYFQPPIGKIQIASVEGWIDVIGFLLTAVVVGQLSWRARRQAAEMERLHKLGQALLGCDRFETAAWTTIHQLVPLFGAKSAAFCFYGTGEIHRAGATEPEIAAARLREAVSLEEPLSDGQTVVIPLRRGGEPFGSVGMYGGPASASALKSIAQLLSITLDRVHAAEEMARQHKEVINQRQIAESLLLNILPAEIANELRANGMVTPKYFEDVTIVFTDFAGFTLSTEKLAAEDLIALLNDYFTAFDRICTRYGLEKLKTVGDSYICMSGLPARNPANPVDAVMAALEMLREVVARDRWKVRIGIHTGPVVAGVVGINKFAFDIWGDTVNFSSRMESSSEPNRINLSERTYSRVKDFFECEHRGKVLTKDKREHDMYFAKGILPRLADGDAFARRYSGYFQKEPPTLP